MRIDLFCNDGSPLGLIPPDIYGKGVGGAELAMMSWAETMAKRGHQIRVFNNPIESGAFDGVQYLPQSLFDPSADRDVFITYRSPNPFTRIAKADVKIHWSCDQYTIGHFGRDIVPYVDYVVCISPYHRDYYQKQYGGGEKVGYFDLGVRLEDYDQDIEKVPGRCIFCSVPDRGLKILRQCWPKIKEQVPHASLVITSDYTLWGSPDPANHQHKISWSGLPDVMFVGKIPRAELVKEQLRAVCQPYPCTYEELFCISTAECQVAGAFPITSEIGALKTTNEAVYLQGDPSSEDWQKELVDQMFLMLTLDTDWKLARLRDRARQRFDWQRICNQWERLIEGDGFEQGITREIELAEAQIS